MVLNNQIGTLQGKVPISYHSPRETLTLNSEFASPPGLSWELTLTKILPCYNAYSYLSWAMSNVLFWQICRACIYYTKLIHLPTVSWCLTTSILVHDSPCSANWVGNVRFPGNDITAARDAPWNALQSLVGKYVVRPQSPSTCVIISKSSHMLGFKLKSPDLLRTRFSLHLLLLSMCFISTTPTLPEC